MAKKARRRSGWKKGRERFGKDMKWQMIGNTLVAWPKGLVPKGYVGLTLDGGPNG